MALVAAAAVGVAGRVARGELEAVPVTRLLMAYVGAVVVCAVVIALVGLVPTGVAPAWIMVAMAMAAIVGGVCVAIEAYWLGQRDEARRAAVAAQALVEDMRGERAHAR